MTSILEEFAYGNITPGAQPVKRDSELGRAMELTSQNERKLADRLGADEKVLLEKYAESQCELNRLTSTHNFIFGYRLGLIMTAEAFVGSGDLVAGEEGC